MDPVTEPQTFEPTPSSSQEPQPVTIGEGLPPIPGKLAGRIDSGKFVELSNLLPDHLSATNVDADSSKASKPAARPISFMGPKLWDLHGCTLQIPATLGS